MTTDGALSGSADVGGIVPISGSIDIVYDGASSDSGAGQDGFIQFTELSSSVDPGLGRGRLYCSSSSDTTKLFFRSGSTQTDLLAGGSDRFTVSAMYRAGGLTNEHTAIFTKDAGSTTSVEQFYFYSAWSFANAHTGSAIHLDHQAVAGNNDDPGPVFIAPRDCELTAIVGTMRGSGSAVHSSGSEAQTSGCARLRLQVFKCTVTQDADNLDPIVLTKIGHADWTKNNGFEAMVGNMCYKFHKLITGSNSMSDGDAAMIALIPIDEGYGTADYGMYGTSYISLTLEFTAS